MGDRATLAKAKMELEQLYLGVPDESVNLTFQDLAEVRQHTNKSTTSPPPTTMEPIPEKSTSSSLAKLPSIDFNRSLHQASIFHNHHRPQEADDQLWGPRGQIHDHGHVSSHHHHHVDDHHGIRSLHGGDHSAGLGHGAGDQRSMMYDDMSHVSGMSVAYGGGGGGGRRRPGVPHSNICTVCSNYIYICRHRCLVCGRVYCRQCVSIGMGEMTEGRKCIHCLGRRFSQRYIHKAGNMGWCMGYRSVVKQQELKWAEKGPRGSGDNRYGGGNMSMMTSTSRSPTVIGTPLASPRPHSPLTNTSNNPPSFVMTSPYSPYSPTNHHPMPF